ncbi:TonB-dependent receptor [Puia dinghuensis]|uniref:Outer membrane protein beta-barrel domain-containing protein n=1 Tax=Puia dinghuensis TaxID=1792502 RepID=A0A8J2XTB6_9BACT|nr:TonB-dependent receptor [Puia dinghuensis]GGB02703.1 hypothetical protein GCM10011511_27500 [Puia dinghuensis]
MKTTKLFLVLVTGLLAFCPLLLFAQGAGGKVLGSILNKEGQVVEAATVLLRRQKDSAVVRSAVTDKTGAYAFGRVAAGNYFLSITCVGYQRYTGGAIAMDSSDAVVVAPDIRLSPAVKDLKAASVVSQKPFVEWKLDKMVVDVAASPFFNPGLSALDVLERSPGITIDYMTSIINLNGRPGTVVYINGRLSYLSGQDLLNYLRGLPAGTLDQIEIMSQPPAKYDAAGSGGVINIILKKNQADGVYGSVTTSAIFGYYFKTRDNFLLNWRKDKLNLNFSYGIADNKKFNDQHIVSSFRSGYGFPFSQYQDYQTSTISDGVSHTPRLSLDYQASKKTTLGANLTGLFSTNNSVTNGPINLYDSLYRMVQHTNFINGTQSPVTNFGANVNLQQKLKKGKELSADADYLYYHSPGTQNSDNYLYDNNGNALAPYLVNGVVPSQIDIYAFKTDYSRPLDSAGKSKLEAGVKTSYVRTDNDAEYTQYDTVQKSWQPDAALTNHFIYTENINAAYLDVSKQLNKKWSVEVGVRAEQTVARGNELVQGNRFTRNYFQVFPDAYIEYKPNNVHSFDANYGRRMDRPSYLDLNPFRYVISQYSFREGNPALQPEYVNDIQVNYHYKGVFSVLLDYIKFDNLFARVVKSSGQGNDLITIQTKENVAFRRNIFLFVFYSRALTKWWNANWLAGFINSKLSDPANTGDVLDQISVFRCDFNNNFPFGKGWSLDLRGFYTTRRLEGIRIYALSDGYFSTGINKKVLKNKGTLTANINDVFYQSRPGQTSEAATFFTKTVNRPESRYLTLTFNYRFGKIKQQQQHSGSADDERGRVNF